MSNETYTCGSTPCRIDWECAPCGSECPAGVENTTMVCAKPAPLYLNPVAWGLAGVAMLCVCLLCCLVCVCCRRCRTRVVELPSLPQVREPLGTFGLGSVAPPVLNKRTKVRRVNPNRTTPPTDDDEDDATELRTVGSTARGSVLELGYKRTDDNGIALT